jgi:hypothetical protein
VTQQDYSRLLWKHTKPINVFFINLILEIIMKKFLAFFVALLLVSAGAFSYEGQGSANASAQFDCYVVAPLTWNTPSSVTLEEVVAGTERDLSPDVTITFELTGEPNYAVFIGTFGPTPAGTNPTTGVTFTGTSGWANVGAQTLNASTGKHNAIYTVDKINSATTADRGNYSWTIAVDAYYTGL